MEPHFKESSYLLSVLRFRSKIAHVPPHFKSSICKLWESVTEKEKPNNMASDDEGATLKPDISYNIPFLGGHRTTKHGGGGGEPILSACLR